jgi:hypothetical protein
MCEISYVSSGKIGKYTSVMMSPLDKVPLVKGETRSYEIYRIAKPYGKSCL